MALAQVLRPPKSWHVPVLLATGVFSGLGAAVFHISNASSYLSEDPKACMNCHIMAPQFATWQRGSHGTKATCNDCHVPHDNIFLKYAFKAMDGSRHAFMYTFHLEPQVIRMHEPGQWAVQNNCIRCHENVLGGHQGLQVSSHAAAQGQGRLCWDCHREVPHGTVNSLSAVPHVSVPTLSPVLPEWVQKNLRDNPQTQPKKQP